LVTEIGVSGRPVRISDTPLYMRCGLAAKLFNEL